MVPLVPAAPQRSLLIQRILRPATDLFLVFLTLLFGLEAAGGVGVAEAVHVDGFHAHTGAAVAAVAGADAVACVLFAVAPFVEGEVLAAHGDAGESVVLVFRW